jgi:hypothetical protein
MRTPDIVLGIFQFVVLLFALSLHESAHGWMASRLGDQTARMLGRITLNPLKHIDPVGTVMLPLVAMVTRIPADWLGQADPGEHAQLQELCARRYSHHPGRAGKQ